ncbi:hypothetical protein ACFWNN_25485 [Lentzea sp. NPDC058450]|uniref:hypothetical protein n=1 Tax=unclassified Lentzea TaxID=2643253 RepID=UPI0033CDF9BB
MNLLTLVGPTIASVVALTIAVIGWRKQTRRDEKERTDRLKSQKAELLAELLELCIANSGLPVGRDVARAKAILLRLPGNIATVLRQALNLRYTMHVPLDEATAVRMKSTGPHDANDKWEIFDAASALTRGSFSARREWIEAEIVYDIAGLMGDDQDAVLAALKKDVRDLSTALRVNMRDQQAATKNESSE